jgi:hypothetical protein
MLGSRCTTEAARSRLRRWTLRWSRSGSTTGGSSPPGGPEALSAAGSPARGRRAFARDVPGRPFIDGWLTFDTDEGVHFLKATSFNHSWWTGFEPRFVWDGEEWRGSLVWNYEVTPKGTIHVLLFGRTFGHRRTYGYFYLRIARGGAVAGPGPPHRADH